MLFEILDIFTIYLPKNLKNSEKNGKNKKARGEY